MVRALLDRVWCYCMDGGRRSAARVPVERPAVYGGALRGRGRSRKKVRKHDISKDEQAPAVTYLRKQSREARGRGNRMCSELGTGDCDEG